MPETTDYLAHLGETPLLTAQQEVELARRIEAGLYAEHLLAEGTTRPGLREVVADGRAAKDHMIRANLRLVVSIAKRYAHRGMSFADVIQDGNVGLIHAVERFDHAKGFRFSTCATWWIRKAIQQGLEYARAVRLPAGVHDRLVRLARAEEVGLTVERSSWLKSLPLEVASLDTLEDLFEDREAVGPEQVVEDKELGDVMAAEIDRCLAPRQTEIIRLRFGLDGRAEHTARQIAYRFGLTPHWARQLEKESLARLRKSRLRVWDPSLLTV